MGHFPESLGLAAADRSALTHLAVSAPATIRARPVQTSKGANFRADLAGHPAGSTPGDPGGAPQPPYRMECLRQALTLQALLGQAGISIGLRFGARKTETEFLAHAWLEYEGRSIELTNRVRVFRPLVSVEEHK